MPRPRPSLPGLALLACLLAPAAVRGAEGPAEKPNVIILFADDMGYGDAGVFGHPIIRTPNIDRMAREGLKLTQFNVAVASCRPSRTSLLTGRYAARIHPTLYYSGGPCAPIPSRELGLAEGLRKAGYATAMTGKWHLRPGPEALGFEKNIEIPNNRNTVRDRTRATLDYIRAHREGPFFFYLPYYMPHVPLKASEKFRGRSVRGPYGDAIEEIDWSVGQILGALKRLGIAENTFVLFTSDNGPWLKKDLRGGTAGLLRGGKGTTWEGGVREPTVAWWPGTIEADTRTSAFTTAMDLYATVLGLAGVKPDTGLIYDGRDMREVFVDGSGEGRREMMVYYYIDKTYEPGGEGDQERIMKIGYEIRAARLGPWKAHFITREKQGSPEVVRETPLLFHLGRDPREKFDIADEHPEVIERINKLLREHVERRDQEMARHDGVHRAPVPE